MYEKLDILRVVFAGFAVGLAMINLMAGSTRGSERVYFLFGIIGIAVAGYFLSPAFEPLFSNKSAAAKFMLFFAHVFYGLFPWFSSYYTGYRRDQICWAISFLAVLSMILLLLTPSVITNDIVWYRLSHIALICVGAYGMAAAFHLLRNKRIGFPESWSFFFSMIIYNILMVEEMLEVYAEIHGIFPPTIAGLPALDIFPIFFMILMGYRIAKDANQRVVLEQALSLREQQWQSFLDDVSLLVIRLDRNGNLTYVNPYFIAFTGYSAAEVIGKNWFSLFYSEMVRPRVAKIFKEVIAGKSILPADPSPILLKSGETRIINWSRVPYYNGSDDIAGFIQVGSDSTDLEAALDKISELKLRLEKETLEWQPSNGKKLAQNKIIGKSETLEYTLNRAYQVAPVDASVLLEGETGVGKELFAELIHEKSKRSNKPLVKVNCAGFPRDLIESELFGHEKGAFTGASVQRKGRFEMAHGGTLFLDEIGEFPLELQPKLLRVLQKGEFERLGGQKTIKVDVRIISATNRNLFEEIKKGNFREDLYYRLNVFPITIPSLRQRKEDIPLLVRFFVDRIGKKAGKPITDISKKDMQQLVDYDWPGNVRELENTVERAIIASTQNTLNLEGNIAQTRRQETSNKPGPPQLSLEEMEKDYIERVLNACDWKINGEKGAAEKLKLHPSTLRSKMKKLKISRPS